MNVPGDLYYTESHEWVRITGGGQALCGITDHAQEMLGDIVYVELPAQGDAFGAGEPMAVVESVKTASDVYAPVGGKVARVTVSPTTIPAL
jgi:glycine cleavage system H protein